MANIKQTLETLLELDGAMCAAVADYNSGMTMGSAGSGLDIELAAAGITEVVRAQMKTVRALGLRASIEDILITLTGQYHLIRPLVREEGIFLYFVLDTKSGNLAMARRKLSNAEKNLQL